MSEERRYDDDEVRRIFERASEAEVTGPPARGEGGSAGLTLEELREIGSEAGIPPALVTRAAGALDREPDEGGRALGVPDGTRLHRILGVPVALQREETLARAPTDEEWARLVADLRRIFSARGRAESMGPVREWRNGNLYVAVAPAEEGAALSMGTRKGSARETGIAGGVLLAIAAVLFVTMMVTGEIAEAGALFPPAFLGAGGLALLGANAVRLPSWARRRARQLEEVGARARALTGGAASSAPPAGPGARGDEEGPEPD